MDREQIEKAIQESARDGKMSCHGARALAERLGVDYREVGDALNDLKVKVRGCELGCF